MTHLFAIFIILAVLLVLALLALMVDEPVQSVMFMAAFVLVTFLTLSVL